MLMNLTKHAWGNFCAVFAAFKWYTTDSINNSSSLHFKFNFSIEVKVPKASIFIISHSRERRYNQAPRSAYLCFIESEVVMFPEYAKVFLMNTNAVFDLHGITIYVRNPTVQILNSSQTITTQLK